MNRRLVVYPLLVIIAAVGAWWRLNPQLTEYELKVRDELICEEQIRKCRDSIRDEVMLGENEKIEECIRKVVAKNGELFASYAICKARYHVNHDFNGWKTFREADEVVAVCCTSSFHRRIVGVGFWNSRLWIDKAPAWVQEK